MSGCTFKSAKEFINDPFSCYKFLTSVRNICLPPRYLGNVAHGIRDQLDTEVNFYCPDLESVVVGYDNVKLLQSIGSIMDDSPFLHFRMQADYVVFQPTTGSILKGVVNKVSKDHVGCLVHSRFNASIHRPRQNLNGWRGSKLEQGEEFPFEVRDIYSNNAVISLSGKLVDQMAVDLYLKQLHSQGVGQSRNGSAVSRAGHHEIENTAFVDSDEGEITLENEPVEVRPKKKRWRKTSEKMDESVDMTDGAFVNISDSATTCKSGSKKGRKRSHESISATPKSPENESESTMLSPIPGKKRKVGSSSGTKKEDGVSSAKKVRFDSSVIFSSSDSPKIKKKKKKKSHVESLDSSDFNSSFNDSFSNSDSGLHSEKEKVPKKKRKSRDETLDSSFASDFDNSIHSDSVSGNGDPSQAREKKNKKSKKKSKTDSCDEIDVTKLKPKSCDSSMDTSDKEKKKKKKKKKEKKRRDSKEDSVDLGNISSGFSKILAGLDSSGKSKTKSRKQEDLMAIVLALQGEVTRAASKLKTATPTVSKKQKRKKKKRRVSTSPEKERRIELEEGSSVSEVDLSGVNGLVEEGDGTGCELGSAGDGSSGAVRKKRKRHSVGECGDVAQTHSGNKKKKFKKRESV